MTSMLQIRTLAPAGYPLTLGSIIGSQFTSREEDAAATLRQYLGQSFAAGTSSGRSALLVALRALSSLKPDRDIVAIPAYTCFSVPAAVCRAGLKVALLDICPGSLTQVPELTVPKDRLLCIIAADLFGFAHDHSELRAKARECGAFFLVDAAQSFGAVCGGELAGTDGDLGIVSLARGKALPTGGGFVVSNSEPIAKAVQEVMTQVRPQSTLESTKDWGVLIATSILLSPWLYGFPNALPFLKLGTTEYEPDFPVAKIGKSAATLFSRKLRLLDALRAQRFQRAESISTRIADLKRFQVIPQPPECKPAFIRFPILAETRELRDRSVQLLNKERLGASAYYPTAICDLKPVREFRVDRETHFPGAETIADRIFTLPTHPLVTDSDVERMVEVLSYV